LDVVAVEGVLLFRFSFFSLARFFFAAQSFSLFFSFKLFWFSSSGYLESFADAVAVAIMAVAVYRCIFTAEL
jgi:ABC-type dipeptide/oligopeptide/nickel transport system permease component